MDKFEFNIKIPLHPKAKFGLKAIFIGIFLIAVGFGAFKLGKEQGHSEGYATGYENGWSESQKSKLIKQSYRVSDLVFEAGPKTMPDFGKLIEDIQKAVEQPSWDANGGPAEIVPYGQDLSLVVNQTQRGHNALKKYLDERRSAIETDVP